MGILLIGISALEFWRHERDAADVLQPGKHVPTFGTAQSKKLLNPSAIEVAELEQRGFSYLSKPVHVLVPDQSLRVRVRGAVCHVHGGNLPAESYLKAAHGIFVARPELALAHLAANADIRELITLAFEVCGTYRLMAEEGFRQAEPVATPESIARYARIAHGLKGRSTLQRCARYTLGGSASPMETAVAMLLSLPCHLGGYGLPTPELNYRIDVGEGLQGIADKRFYVVDMCWPKARLAVEYDSDQFHVGAERIAADADRKNALAHMGFEVLVVGRQRVMSLAKMDGTARIVAKQLGTRIRPQGKEWRLRQTELRRAVLPSSNQLYW